MRGKITVSHVVDAPVVGIEIVEEGAADVARIAGVRAPSDTGESRFCFHIREVLSTSKFMNFLHCVRLLSICINIRNDNELLLLFPSRRHGSTPTLLPHPEESYFSTEDSLQKRKGDRCFTIANQKSSYNTLISRSCDDTISTKPRN